MPSARVRPAGQMKTELPPPPSPAPTQQWAILPRVPQVSRIDLSRKDFSLALAAPPDLSELSISSTIAELSFSAGFIPFVLAADPSGLLLVSDAYGRATDPLGGGGGGERPAYFVWDAANVVTHRALAHEEAVHHSGNVGFIVSPTKHGRYHDFTVAELLPVAAGESVTILCYDSFSHIWEKKTLPFPMPRYPWSSANVFSHDRKLWWADLRHGILSCDPLSDTPEVLFVPLPEDVATTPSI
ncbi:uncharacterized protein LOC104582525 [Brachypodium distachyon]|uniref:uncharacterized protein LOC104582525 n=1 Tax=Brachypodium distachyon TaxID=15368 RepID=UPI00052FE585|nr:uncharacterized protein LOC104582525 [Brachypodium distachyon]|eukprot:XP_010230676.1 uncharacterized protein LOC104582525 [Brachypodium distachyon]